MMLRPSRGSRGRLHGAAWVLLISSQAACLPIPHVHTAQPRAIYSVRDSTGRAIAGARLILRGSPVVAGPAYHRDLPLDTLGNAQTQRRREFHPFLMLMPDAEAPWEWQLCAEAPGYRLLRGPEFRETPRDTVRLVLEPIDGPEPSFARESCAPETRSIRPGNQTMIRPPHDS
jgi:hypothetical protein